MLFCPTHKIPLQESQILFQGLNKHVYHAANQENCTAERKEFIYSMETADKIITLAQNISYLLDNVYPSRTLDWFTRRYQTLLIEKGYANAIGRVRQKRLIDDFVEFYGEEFLTNIDSMVIYENESNWLSQISKKHRKVFHPIRHLLMIGFLTQSVDHYFQNNKQYRPFGRSPWLCLNAAADHYLQPVITDLKVTHCLENKKPLGTFTCSCGMIYSRSGEDKTEEDKLRIGRVITYGQVWEDKLRELVEVKKLGLRATARKLRVDPNTINRYVSLLDLTPSWTTGNQSKPKKVQKAVKNLPDLEKLTKEKKDRWLTLQQENPELSKTEIRKLAPDIYAWLYRHDKHWLNENSPKLKQSRSSVDKIDWSLRDKEILNQAKSAVDEILKKDKPVRITVGRIGSFLGLKALLEKHLDKLPLTRVYLESVRERVEDFQIRRVEWAFKELDRRGEEIKEWKILKIAGLRNDLTPKVRKYLEKHSGNDSVRRDSISLNC